MMSIFPRRYLVVFMVALVALPALATGRAQATDIESLRTRAQDLSARVAILEQKLSGLQEQKALLDQRIAHTSAQIGVLELEKHELDAAYDEAQSNYISRAVQAYKAGPTARFELLLGADTMSQMLDLLEAQVRAADKDAKSLMALYRARVATEQKQNQIDKRQQELISTHVKVQDVTTQTQLLLATRQEILNEVLAQVAELEQAARLAASGSSKPTEELLKLLAPAGPSPEIPDGFAGTGVKFEGIASWYGPGFEGNTTASGDVFDPDLYTAASRDLPFGTWLFVRYGGRGVVVLVNDRGPYIENRVLDLSQAAAEAIGLTGIGWIEAEILVKT